MSKIIYKIKLIMKKIKMSYKILKQFQKIEINWILKFNQLEIYYRKNNSINMNKIYKLIMITKIQNNLNNK